ncbi:kinase-like protein [Guyanagaster necrorhizus]|uniref:Kinase-like protein n=1 Tax=Guyanagaster necrorhizus TaxID=856835 RepID=A0A9P7VNE0_9AGAR|nr:kinase-like protein [Guyanagaster necrorhizus MCA 3950]KAG7444388.1 kinase-like protein [Guyanagaster necrorhizus MCA 3950]
MLQWNLFCSTKSPNTPISLVFKTSSDEGRIYSGLWISVLKATSNTAIRRDTFFEDNEHIRSIFIQILVAHCHDLGVYHWDLKPKNIFCSSNGWKVFLADFGLSTWDAMSNNFICGTPAYMSPGQLVFLGEISRHWHFCAEIIDKYDIYERHSSRHCDIWSLGFIFPVCLLLLSRISTELQTLPRVKATPVNVTRWQSRGPYLDAGHIEGILTTRTTLQHS